MIRALLLGLCVASTCCFAEFKTFLFHDRLSLLLQTPKYRHVDLGISIQNLSKPEPYRQVYRKNDTDKFIPASMMKIFLSATVLTYYHPLDQFETPVYTNGYISNNVLNGDLIVKGIGDPSLRTSHLVQIVEAVKTMGIEQINGDIIYDDSFFVETPYTSKSARYYNAPSSALNINKNVVRFRINSDYTGLEPIEESSYVTFHDRTKILPHSTTYGFPSLRVSQEGYGDYYTIRGNVTPQDELNHNLECVITRPSLYFATYLYELFNREGINVLGGISKGEVDEKGILLGLIKGDPLNRIIYDLNHESNNMIVSSLCKSLGGTVYNAPGTKEKGLKVMNRFASEKLKIYDLNVSDASGLSLDNRLSPQNFSDLFHYIYETPHLGRFVLDSMIQQGEHPDYQHPKPPDHLVVRLKTGTLAESGVNTVGGYIYDAKNSEMYTFVIMADNKKSTPKAYKGTFTNPVLTLIMDSIR